MGFIKPKAPEPAPAPVAPIPTAEPLVTSQTTTDQAEADKVLKKKQQLRAGKSSLTVGLKTTGVNLGGTDTNTSTGLSVGGA